MPVDVVLALIVLAALVVYALTGGADYGGGMWDLLATGPRAERQRDVVEHAIAPIWEANHVWLILVVVVLFTAFPPAFGAMMTALHVPITLVLLGIVLRGSAFAFRKYDPRGRRRWGTIFGMASVATPFFLGLTLGGLASGEIRVVDGRVTTGFFAGWTSPFALACGAYAQGLFAFLAAVYLTVDAEGEADVQHDSAAARSSRASRSRRWRRSCSSWPATARRRSSAASRTGGRRCSCSPRASAPWARSWRSGSAATAPHGWPPPAR